MDRLTALLEVYPPITHGITAITLSAGDGLEQHCENNCSVIYLQNSGSSQVQMFFADSGSEASDTLNSVTIIDLKPGDLLWLPQGKGHFISSVNGAELSHINLAFGDQTQNMLMDTLPQALPIPGSQFDSSDMAPLIQLMTLEALQPRCGQSVVLNRLAEVLLVKMLRYIIANHTIETGVLGGLADLRLAKALTAVHQNPAFSWNLENLAHTAGMSRTAFSQQFKRVVGYTPADYVTHWRMRIACQRLLHGKEGIGQIGEQLGYQSETAFRRAFRRALGIPPGEYKKQQLEQAA